MEEEIWEFNEIREDTKTPNKTRDKHNLRLGFLRGQKINKKQNRAKTT